jgi:cation diffusion facilitator CzcD-associated flavoprotein CzcO
VDSAIPFYEFSDPALWEEWRWKERFPGSAELRSYFAFVAHKWNLRKDTEFETFVSSATWDDTEAKWTIHTKAGKVFKAKYLLLNTGFAAKRYIPDWKGIDSFEGDYTRYFLYNVLV